jgi:hypothetical protein
MICRSAGDSAERRWSSQNCASLGIVSDAWFIRIVTTKLSHCSSPCTPPSSPIALLNTPSSYAPLHTDSYTLLRGSTPYTPSSSPMAPLYTPLPSPYGRIVPLQNPSHTSRQLMIAFFLHAFIVLLSWLASFFSAKLGEKR